MPTPITPISQLDPNGTYSYADYLTWHFTELVELIRGKIMRRISAPTDQHQAVVGEIFALFHTHLRRQTYQVRVAPYDVRLPQRVMCACRNVAQLPTKPFIQWCSRISVSFVTLAKSSPAAVWARPI
jgi:hypothetical protein